MNRDDCDRLRFHLSQSSFGARTNTSAKCVPRAWDDLLDSFSSRSSGFQWNFRERQYFRTVLSDSRNGISRKNHGTFRTSLPDHSEIERFESTIERKHVFTHIHATNPRALYRLPEITSKNCLNAIHSPCL